MVTVRTLQGYKRLSGEDAPTVSRADNFTKIFDSVTKGLGILATGVGGIMTPLVQNKLSIREQQMIRDLQSVDEELSSTVDQYTRDQLQNKKNGILQSLENAGLIKTKNDDPTKSEISTTGVVVVGAVIIGAILLLNRKKR